MGSLHRPAMEHLRLPARLGAAFLGLGTLGFAALNRPALSVLPSRTVQSSSPSLDALIVGGGPSLQYNQFGIESNVRYVTSLIPQGGMKRVLFADGSKKTRDVQYLSPSGNVLYRAPRLKQIDGPSTIASFDAALSAILGLPSTQTGSHTPADRLDDSRGSMPSEASPGESIADGSPVAAPNSRPLLLYFTGHGGPDESGDYLENDYGLWKDGSLTVSDLRTRLDRVPADRPTVLVMVQCFSGAFGDLVFRGKRESPPSSPKGSSPAVAEPPDTRPLRENFCGFFASVAEREAAGCTPEVNEAEYHDFTSYFFAALSGHDRVGRAVSGADYNADGRVGMDEAFAYTMIHDISIDTPVSTSDAFLRSAVTTSNDDIFKTRYTDVRKWASPCQAAVLKQIGEKLKLSGDSAVSRSYYIMARRLRSEDEEDSENESQTALWVRFVRTAKTVILEHELMAGDDSQRKAQLSRLLASEAESLPLITRK